MKIPSLAMILCCAAFAVNAEERVVPAGPPIQKLRALAAPSVIVLLCRPNKDRSALEVASILKGQALYQKHKEAISELLPRGDTKALNTDGYAEIFFYQKSEGPTGIRWTSSYALWPERVDTLRDGLGRDYGQIRFLAHDMKELKKVIANDANMAEQAVPSDGHMPTSRVPSDGPTAPADAH